MGPFAVFTAVSPSGRAVFQGLDRPCKQQRRLTGYIAGLDRGDCKEYTRYKSEVRNRLDGLLKILIFLEGEDDEG